MDGGWRDRETVQAEQSGEEDDTEDDSADTLTKNLGLESDDDMDCTPESPGMKHPRNRQKSKKTGHSTVKKKPWSHEEKSAVEKHLSRFITMIKVPGKKACAEAVELESALQCQSWEAAAERTNVTERKVTGQKETDGGTRRKETGRMEAGWMETGRKETGESGTGRKETGRKKAGRRRQDEIRQDGGRPCGMRQDL
ncbi:hypothetical protein LSAT2_023891 [Lamellibrachia satsuma]|nr:hypothetical protein LSAT2_023891 [Lamellibrachia satsuma]